MKRLFTLLIIAGTAAQAVQAQSAIGQLERMTGTSINRYHNNESYRAGASSGWDSGGGGGLADALLNAVDDYADKRAERWAERKAARDALKDELRYSRTSHHKLKDYKPIDPKANKTLPTGLGATGNLAVYAKYDKNANPTYGIWNTEKSKWQYKPQYSALSIVGPHAAAATLKGKVGIIDPATGKVTTDFTFDKYKGFHYPESALNTFIALGKTSPEGKESWYLMMADADGNYVQSGPELSAISCYEDGTGNKALYRTAESKKVGMLNEKGKELLPPVFDGLMYLKFTADDASCYQARLTDGSGHDRFGVIDEYGRSIVPCTYDKVEPMNDGKYGIRVQQNGKMGWYGTDGTEIFPAGFDDLQLDHFYDGSKHRAYFRGVFIDERGEQYSALFDTAGRRLTDFAPGLQSDASIRDLAGQLEEYRIY